MAAHAKLAPSAAERWIQCPASVRMEAHVPAQVESAYAEEGTCAHVLGEMKARLAFDMITPKEFQRRLELWRKEFAHILDHEVEVEMGRHTDEYVQLLQERMELYPNSQLMLEQRLDTGIPTCWGTSDAVIVSPLHVEIVDFKYGQGVEVEAEGNPQLRLYALGALDTYGDLLGETQVVRSTVHQPRLNHVLTEELTPQELLEWRSRIIPIAEEALGPDAHFGPSDSACRWCPASGRCQAQLEKVFAEPFQLPEVLTPEAVADTLARVPEVREWLKAFEEAALNMAYSEGQHIPGYKVVMSGGKRAVRDHEAAVNALVEAGYDPEEVSRRQAKTLGDLEKLLGKQRFKELLEDRGIVTKGEGQPSLVLESDKRPAVQPNSEAAKVFGEDLL